MTERAQILAATAQAQMTELIELLTTLDEVVLQAPCSGREKLGDGTIGAAVQHTADNYQRIAGFVDTSSRMSAGHQPAAQGKHHIPKFMRVSGHAVQEHVPADHGTGGHDDGYTAKNVDVGSVLEQLDTCRDKLGQIAELTDRQLHQVPPKDSFRFCDGQRTLEQVLAGLLKHQAHQLQALSSST